MKSKWYIAFVLAMATLLFAACSDSDSAQDEADIKTLVNEYSVGEKTADNASITATELIVSDNNEEATYELPEEEFFVSIAPFENETHPCDIHSLTGCQGELVNQDVDVSIEDSEGNVVLEDKMNTGDNGFLDFWLPREDAYQVKMSANGKSVKSEIATFPTDGTCITTMQLL